MSKDWKNHWLVTEVNFHHQEIIWGNRVMVPYIFLHYIDKKV